jgi:hypothetical protein
MSFIDEGEGTKFGLDDMGEVECKITLADGRIVEGMLRLRQPAGFQARPVDDRIGHDALILRDGRLQEVLALVDRDATSKLPELKSGQTRIHSLDEQPQLISILMNEILVGKNAQRGGARKDDEVGGGTITLASVQNPGGPPPTFNFTVTYVDAKGATTTWGPAVIAGTAPVPPTATFKLLELIKTASDLVKVQ